MSVEIVRQEKSTEKVAINSLKVGDCFIYNGGCGGDTVIVYQINTKATDQSNATNLSTGERLYCCLSHRIIPINIIIQWSSK